MQQANVLSTQYGMNPANGVDVGTVDQMAVDKDASIAGSGIMNGIGVSGVNNDTNESNSKLQGMTVGTATNGTVQNPMNLPSRAPAGTGIIRLIHMSEQLSASIEETSTVKFWKFFVPDYFSCDNGIMRCTLWHEDTHEKKMFQIPYALLIRYYHSLYTSGVVRIQFVLAKYHDVVGPRGTQLIECKDASIIYHYRSGSQVVTRGHLRVQFALPMYRIDVWDFVATNHKEYIPRDSPNIPRQINKYGVTLKTMRCFEMAESVAYMRELMLLSCQNRQMDPSTLLSKFVSQMKDSKDEEKSAIGKTSTTNKSDKNRDVKLLENIENSNSLISESLYETKGANINAVAQEHCQSDEDDVKSASSKRRLDRNSVDDAKRSKVE